ncbi:Acetyltransferase (GNAT) family protein [Nitrosospira sp. Nsp18]|nr:Acetyltransferase (GNAT) family protein [Nitrosospira sp. Nsp18]
MSLVLTKASLERAPWLLSKTLNIVSQDAEFLRSSYPLFDQWFVSKVLPGIHTGVRTLLIEERDSMVVGLLILKHTETEKKLCTLRVRPSFESKGLGVRLFQTAFQLLGTERPLLSVSEITAPRFERLFTYFGFAQEGVYQGRYIPMVDELAYNGLLDPAPLPR